MDINLVTLILTICYGVSAYSGYQWIIESKKDTANFYIGLVQLFLAGVLLTIAAFYC